jgi:hypothetical protein
MASPFLADIRDRMRAAGREVHEAAKAERRARQHFADHVIELDQLRDAIRRCAFAEKRAEDLAMVMITLERLQE